MHLWSKTCERVKDLKQEKMDCVKHAGFKHARFHSAFTPTLIPLTSTGTGLIYSIVNSQNESCRWSLAEHLFFSRQAPLGLFRAMPPAYSQVLTAEICWSEQWCAQTISTAALLPHQPGQFSFHFVQFLLRIIQRWRQAFRELVIWEQLISLGSKLSSSLVKHKPHEDWN